MSIAPFSTRPAAPAGEAPPRTWLVLAIATVGIAATLLAYAASPGVRHAVGHAEHSVKHAVSNVFDHDHAAGAPAKPRSRPASAGRAQKRPHAQGAAPQARAKAGGG